jgi:hypothetical protein
MPRTAAIFNESGRKTRISATPCSVQRWGGLRISVGQQEGGDLWKVCSIAGQMNAGAEAPAHLLESTGKLVGRAVRPGMTEIQSTPNARRTFPGLPIKLT